jgi:hypothetical protein
LLELQTQAVVEVEVKQVRLVLVKMVATAALAS